MSSSFAPMLRRITDRIPARLRNRYGLSTAILLAWVMLFADNDIWRLYKNHRELGRIEEQMDWYEQELARTQEQLREIDNDKELLEKFARERYLMKRENEDIFVLVADAN